MKNGELIAGFDIGTTSSKLSVIDLGGRIVATAKTRHEVDVVKPGFVEQKAELWWSDIAKLTQLISRQIPLSSIKAVGLSSMCPTVLPVNENGVPLRPAILYGIDQRAKKQIGHINDLLGSGQDRSIYTRHTTQSLLPKILWLKENEHDTYINTAKILSTSGYIAYKMTGNFVADYFSMSAGNIVDLNNFKIYKEAFEAAGIDPALLPEIKWPAEIAGELSHKASVETGLNPGIPVITGMGDAGADTIISSSFEPGDVSISLGGTSICIETISLPLRSDNLFVNTHVLKDLFIIGGATSCGGLYMEWLSNKIFNKTVPEIVATFKEVDFHPSGIVNLPFLSGARTPFNDTNARGTLIGLNLNTGREELYMSALEAISIDIFMILEEIRRDGLRPENISVSGGGTHNRTLLKVLAEVLETPIKVAPHQYDSATGAALIAGSAFEGDNVISNLRKLLPEYQTIEPSLKYVEYFGMLKDLFLKSFERNKETYQSLLKSNF